MIWAAIVVGSIFAATHLIAFGLCKAAARGDRALQRAHGERLAMEMDRVYWRRRYPERHWPGCER